MDPTDCITFPSSAVGNEAWMTWLVRLLWLATHTHTHPFNSPFSGLPGWTGTRKVKPIWILLKPETVSGSGIRWDICKSATRSRQITMPAPHHSDCANMHVAMLLDGYVGELWQWPTLCQVCFVWMEVHKKNDGNFSMILAQTYLMFILFVTHFSWP